MLCAGGLFLGIAMFFDRKFCRSTLMFRGRIGERISPKRGNDMRTDIEKSEVSVDESADGHRERWDRIYAELGTFVQAFEKYVDKEGEAGSLEGDYGLWVWEMQDEIRLLEGRFHAARKCFSDHELKDDLFDEILERSYEKRVFDVSEDELADLMKLK